MTIINNIQNKRVIELGLFGNDKLIYTGICLKANQNFWLIVNYDFKTKCFDGYSVFRNKDVNTYSVWKKKEIVIKENNLDEFVLKLPIKKINTFYSCLKKLDNRLIAFFTESELDSYYVGKIISLDIKRIKIKLIDTKGNWTRLKTFNLFDIKFFSFDTKYEMRLSKKIKK